MVNDMTLPDPVRALYPFASHFLDQLGARQHFVDEGPREALPVLLVHGNPTWSFYYRRVIEALRANRRVIAPDHVGCGLSDRPRDADYAYTLARRIYDLERLVDHLAVPCFDLVVHDWGGMIGMGLAARRPAAVRRIVVLNTAAFRLPVAKTLPWQLKLCRSAAAGAVLVRGLNAFCLGAQKTCVMRPLSAAVRRGYLVPYRSWSARRAVHRFVQDIPLAPGDLAYGAVVAVEDALPRLGGKPMLILWGARDFVFDGDFLAAWQQHFPGAMVHRYADAGHFVLEDAWEDAVPRITDFLERADA